MEANGRSLAPSLRMPSICKRKCSTRYYFGPGERFASRFPSMQIRREVNSTTNARPHPLEVELLNATQSPDFQTVPTSLQTAQSCTFIILSTSHGQFFIGPHKRRSRNPIATSQSHSSGQENSSTSILPMLTQSVWSVVTNERLTKSPSLSLAHGLSLGERWTVRVMHANTFK